MSIPNLDEKKKEIKEDDDDVKREDHNLLCEGCLGEQAFWFYDGSVMFLNYLEAAPALAG